MRLWTYQWPDFRPTDCNVKVNISKSRYAETLPKYRDAYKKLSDRLGTDQIIWCCTRQDEYKYLLGEAPMEWELEVPAEQILACISSYVWNKILGVKRFTVSCEIRHQWLTQALELAPNDPEKLERIRETLEEQFYAPEPEENLWNRLLLKEPSDEGCSVLLKHPIKESWVIRVVDLRCEQ